MERPLGEPVIATFALSAEEWARVSAALKAGCMLAQQQADKNGKVMPDEVGDVYTTALRFSNMIDAEVFQSFEDKGKS